MTNKIKNIIATLPNSPGVYIFKDSSGEILYIGKAKALKKRVQSYFNRPLDTKNQAMVSKIAGIEYRLTPSEPQAQILEASLIKENQPLYNIDLKDDKSFPWVRISDEEFPVVSIMRKKGRGKNDHSLYFGPYTNVKLLRQALKVVRKIFSFRSCKNLPAGICLYGRLNLCPAPCVKKISPADYRGIINRIQLFLESKYEELIRQLGQQMQRAVAARNFEEAAKIRDQINALSAIGQGGASHISLFELEDLKNLLKLHKSPVRIEAFDISNISGHEASGAMVSFFKGLPDKNNYRRFRIKSVEGVDDYKMLAEVVRRRYRRILEEKMPFPDLVVIDGGRGHLLAADREIRALGMQLSLVSIAKEKEHIYIKGRVRPIKLKSDTPALNLIRKIRDEAHRFAIKYHHLLHRKKIIGK